MAKKCRLMCRERGDISQSFLKKLDSKEKIAWIKILDRICAKNKNVLNSNSILNKHYNLV